MSPHKICRQVHGGLLMERLHTLDARISCASARCGLLVSRTTFLTLNSPAKQMLHPLRESVSYLLSMEMPYFRFLTKGIATLFYSRCAAESLSSGHRVSSSGEDDIYSI